MGESKTNSMMPREKLERYGLGRLTDVDLVTVLLGTGVKGRGVKKVARSVVRRLRKTARMSKREKTLEVDWRAVSQIRGLGKAKSMQIICAIELGRRIFGEGGQERKIQDRKAVFEEVKYLKDRKQEHVVVLLLDARNFLIKKKTVAIGSSNLAVLQPRDIFESAFEVGASGIILVHNHPSGVAVPSQTDRRFAKRLEDACKVVGIRFVDSVVV